jgi:hypothetical protein
MFALKFGWYNQHPQAVKPILVVVAGLASMSELHI